MLHDAHVTITHSSFWDATYDMLLPVVPPRTTTRTRAARLSSRFRLDNVRAGSEAAARRRRGGGEAGLLQRDGA